MELNENTAVRPRVRLFRTPFLEAATLTPFSAFVTVWSLLLASAVACTLPRLSWTGTVGLPIGAAAWFLFEYAMHRTVFHFEANSAWTRRLLFLLHENHHQDPTDPLRGLMPLPVTVPIALLVWFAARTLGPTCELASIGFVASYVLYDATHWACHHLPMRGRLAVALKRHHLRHHYATEHCNFAITAIFLDRWFGTSLKRR